jgi:hypothetical protein
MANAGTKVQHLSGFGQTQDSIYVTVGQMGTPQTRNGKSGW